jgi:hypothetical protein
MPRKKRARRPARKAPKPPAGKKMTKTEFVRSQPEGTPAKAIVEAAKQRGMTLSVAYVYNIRGAAKKKAGQPGRRPARRVAGATAGLGGRDELAFKQMVLNIGIRKARQLMAEIEADFQSLAQG